MFGKKAKAETKAESPLLQSKCGFVDKQGRFFESVDAYIHVARQGALKKMLDDIEHPESMRESMIGYEAYSRLDQLRRAIIENWPEFVEKMEAARKIEIPAIK